MTHTEAEARTRPYWKELVYAAVHGTFGGIGLGVALSIGILLYRVLS